MVQFQLKKLYIGLIFLFLSISVYSQGPPRLRFTQLPQSDSIGSLLLTNSQKNLEFTNNLRYLNNVFSVVGGANFDDSTLVIDAVNNRVGIGTSTPNGIFNVANSFNGFNVSYFSNYDAGASARVGIIFQNEDTTGADAVFQLIGDRIGQTSRDKFQILTGSRIDNGIQFLANNGGITFSRDSPSNVDMYIQDGTGNVGIGTDSPNARLEIKSDGSAGAGAEIRLQHANNNSTDVVSTVNFANNIGSVAMIQGGTTGANNTGYISFFTDKLGTSSEKVRIIGNGNVGIGTTSPAALLDVNGTFNSSGVVSGAGLRSNNIGGASTSGTGWFKIAKVDSRGGGIITLSFTGGNYAPVTYVIKYYKNWTSDTTLKLEKYGDYDHITDVRFIRDDSDSKYYIEFLTGSNNLGFQVYHDWTLGYNASTTMYTGALSAGASSGTTTSSLPFVDSGTSTHSQHVSSTLGIGTTNPTSNLHVVNTESAYVKVERTTVGSEGHIIIGATTSANRVYSNGINLTTGKDLNLVFGGNDTHIFKSDGEVFIKGTTDRGTYNLQVNGTGVWGQGAYVNGSDIRMKENIIPITNALNKVKNLNPVGYNYKAEYSQDQSPQLGFIAQEVNSVLEEYAQAVVKDEGDMLSMAYQNLIPVLTKAVQEQQAIIETQEQKIQELETLLQTLVSRIETLENK